MLAEVESVTRSIVFYAKLGFEVGNMKVDQNGLEAKTMWGYDPWPRPRAG